MTNYEFYQQKLYELAFCIGTCRAIRKLRVGKGCNGASEDVCDMCLKENEEWLDAEYKEEK